MPHLNPTDPELREQLISARSIAMVGTSAKPDRPSNEIMRACDPPAWAPPGGTMRKR